MERDVHDSMVTKSIFAPYYNTCMHKSYFND